MIWLLSLFPEAWLERALRCKPNVFSVLVIKGDEVHAMAKAMSALEAPEKEPWVSLELH